MFKNWAAIGQTRGSMLFKLAIVMLDMNSELARRLIEALPELFSETESGSVPLSVVRAAAVLDEYCDENHLNQNEVLQTFGLPAICFNDSRASHPMPDMLPPHPEFEGLAFGAVVEWLGEKLMLVDDGLTAGGPSWITFVPLNRLVVDVPEFQTE